MYIVHKLLTEITAAQNEDALVYHRVRGLYFLAVVLVATVQFVHSLDRIENYIKMDYCISSLMRQYE